MMASASSTGPMVPLTEAQSGLWYAQRLDRLNSLFNTAQYVEIDGPLDVMVFKRAADMAIWEADALALAIEETPQGPMQRVVPERRPWLEIVDFSEKADGEAAAFAAIRADGATPVDPATQKLARQQLFVLGPKRFIWYQRIHHLATDGYGTMLLNRRIAALYDNGGTGGEPLSPFSAVLDEDETYRGSGQRVDDAGFWRETLADLPEVTGMAPGRALSADRYHRTNLVLTAGQAQGIGTIAALGNMPWPDALISVVGAYCQRFTASAEVVLGVPHMGRFGSAAARVPAMVMNVLPLRLLPAADKSLVDYLSECGASLALARRHGRYRGEQMRRDLGLIGGQRRLHGPLVNVLPFDRPIRLAGLDLRTTVLGTGPVDDITFTFRGDPSLGLRLEVDTNPLLYGAEETEEHAHRLLGFIESVANAPTLGDIALVHDEEARRLIAQAAGPDRELPETALTSLLLGKMAETPEVTAVVFGGDSLSYGQLERRSGALAARLRSMGVVRESLVAVALPRSLELVVALLAVLRAGGAYLPLDMTHPPDRLARILASARPVLVLTDESGADRLPAELSKLGPGDWPDSGAAPAVDSQPDDAAYVIYTSGSTGEPKGVVIEHRAIVNRLLWMAEHYGFDATDRILQKTPATFDVSVWEFFLPLLVGATLVMAPPEAHRDPAAIAALVREKSITTLHFVPSMLAAFLAEPAAAGLVLRRVFCSGEELAADLRDRFHTVIDAELHNLYGPTEAAVDVSYWPAGLDDSSVPVPIGRPVWNTRLYVLDERRRPVPPGVTGHLYLAGVQLARGYLGRADLTAERFVPDPFVSGERMYLTGDLARIRRDWAVVYLGRADQQIKLRGLRIELGEIEAAVIQSGHASQCAVIVREDYPGQRRLVAYVVPAAGYSEAALRSQLMARLPDYMVPAAVVPLPGLPVTSNGKLDRSDLPAPALAAVPSRAPSSATEQLLARLFAETLGMATLPGVEADFFALGGDSLSAINLLLGIREQLGRDPGLGTLFANSTIAVLAAAIDQAGQELDSGLGPVIVLAKTRFSLPPLFLVHPAGGLAWCYRNLASALTPRRPAYGLQAPGLDPAVGVPESLDALAAEYADRILALETPGPIHLAGWSVGGLIAQAVAVRMQELGVAVGLLAMLDSYPAECWRAEPEPDAMAALRALLAIAGYDPAAHAELDSRAAIVSFLQNGDSALAGLPEASLDGVIRTVTDTNRLVRNHYHRHFHGTLTHIRAALDHQGRALHPDQWLPYAEAVERIDVPSLHPQLTGAAATALIAPELSRRLAILDRRKEH